MNLDPKTIRMDFEIAMMNAMNAMKSQFPKALIVGCLFHFKKAIRRKLTKLAIEKDQISTSELTCCIGILTVPPKKEIRKKRSLA